MTEGMPASNSMTLFMNVEIAPSLEYSPKKMEIGREKRVEIARAKRETKRVPTTKGKAPNAFLTGSHVAPKRNPTPKWPIEGMAVIARDKKIAIRMTSTNPPATYRIFRKKDSDRPSFHPAIVLLWTLARKSSVLRSIRIRNFGSSIDR